MKKETLLMLFIMFSSMSTFAQSSEDFKQAIQMNFQKMGEAMANSNPELLATHFSEDAMLKLPGLKALEGRKAIANAHAMMIEQGISIRPMTKEVESFGDTGYEIGTYQMFNKEGMEVDAGTYSTIWKKVDGDWKLYRDIVSSSTPQK
ncbi:nuclear transport factor 2 family protein [Psychroflexus sp. CAK1W]|uniref:YybH family protein n=1 Tax=Psychroflexus curvus TaxID=2873595 RepID=UPI001CCDF2CC|nr:nuclear transport factor 2 family protein [Psychroflexus curvus]MBZ9628135.1 nuclear transport factor 2 family protein [Psychroflexus curvus]